MRVKELIVHTVEIGYSHHTSSGSTRDKVALSEIAYHLESIAASLEVMQRRK